MKKIYNFIRSFFMLVFFSPIAGFGDEVVNAIDESDFPEDFVPIDETGRTERMMNDCVMYAVSEALNAYYFNKGAYPAHSKWAKEIKKSLLGSSGCVEKITFTEDGLTDYSESLIQYIHENKNKVILYSVNLRNLSSRNVEAYKAFVLNDGHTELYDIFTDKEGYELKDLKKL